MQLAKQSLNLIKENIMIDSAMLARLIEQTGSYSYISNSSFLPLAKAIWNAAQAEEREECAKICDNIDCRFDDAIYELGTQDCAKAIRNRKT